MSLSIVPPEILQQIALELPIDELVHLCKTNIRIERILCFDDRFWRLRLTRDLDITVIPKGMSPRDYYIWIYRNRRWFLIESDGVFQPIEHNVKRIAVGDSAVLLEDTDGRLWAIGSNVHKTITPESYILYFAFTQIEYPENIGITDMSVNYALFAILDGQGRLWVKGDNIWQPSWTDNIIGFSRPTDQPVGFTKVEVGDRYLLALGSDGKIWGTGLGLKNLLNRDIDRRFVEIWGADREIVKISAGPHHAMFLDSTGDLWGIGSNRIGQLGLGKILRVDRPVYIRSNIVDVCCGAYSSLLLDNNGDVLRYGAYSSTEPEVIFEGADKISRPTENTNLLIDRHHNLWSYNARAQNPAYLPTTGPTKAWSIQSGANYMVFNGVVLNHL